MSQKNCELDNPNAESCNIDTSEANLLNGIKPISMSIIPSSMFIFRDSITHNFKKYYSSNNAQLNQSKFFRKINISKTGLQGEAIVRVMVTWKNLKEGDQNIYLKNYIYNYSNNPEVQSSI